MTSGAPGVADSVWTVWPLELGRGTWDVQAGCGHHNMFGSRTHGEFGWNIVTLTPGGLCREQQVPVTWWAVFWTVWVLLVNIM